MKERLRKIPKKIIYFAVICFLLSGMFCMPTICFADEPKISGTIDVMGNKTEEEMRAYTSGFVYNQAVFQKAGITQTPKTTDEFLDDLRAVKEYTDAIPFYTNYVSDWALNIWETYPFIDMTGDMDYKQNVFVNEKNPYRIGSSHDTVYHLLYDMVEEGLCEEDINAGDWAESKALLNEGKIAVWQLVPGQFPSLRMQETMGKMLHLCRSQMRLTESSILPFLPIIVMQ